MYHIFLLSSQALITKGTNTISAIKPFKYISIYLTIAIATIFLLSLLFRIDAIQRRLALYVTEEIKKAYNIPLEMDMLKIRNLGEFSLSNVTIRDLKNDTIVHAGEITAHISPHRLMRGEIQINTLTFAQPTIKLNRATKEAPLNIQFIIDNLGSKEKKSDNNLVLRINQLLIYDGNFRYDILDAPQNEEPLLDPKHIAVNDFACNVSLKKFHRDTLDIQVRSIRGKERSGFELKKLRARINATAGSINIRNLQTELPHSRLKSKKFSIAFNNGKPSFYGDIESPQLQAIDLSALGIRHLEKIPSFSFLFNGASDSIKSATSLSISTLSDGLKLKIDGKASRIYNKERTASVDITQCHIDKHTTALLYSFFTDSTTRPSDIIGDITLNGKLALEDGKLNGHIETHTQCGDIIANFLADKDSKYTLNLSGKEINLKAILGNNAFTSCDLKATASGVIKSPVTPILFNGTITDLTAGGYKYSPIEYKGSFAPEEIHASATIDDPGLETSIQATYLQDKERKISITAAVDTLIPHMIGFNEKPSKQYSFNMNGEFSIDKNNKTLINAKFQNFTLNDGDQREIVRNFHICDNNLSEQRLIVISSDFINGSIIGNYNYQSMISNLGKLATRHTPSLNESFSKTKEECNYIFKFDISDSRFVSRLLETPITINGKSEISGSCNSLKEIFRFNTMLSDVNIGNNRFNTIALNGTSDNDRFTINARANKQSAKNTTNGNNSDIVIGMQCTILNDTIKNNIYWDNNLEKNKMKGSLRMDAMLGRNENHALTIDARIHPDSIVHNDSVWYLSDGTITGNPSHINIKKVKLYNDTQHIMVDGIAGNEPDDSLFINTSNFEVSTILDLVNFRALRFAGCATGEVLVTNILAAPDIAGEFHIDSFKIDYSYMGNSDIKVNWSNQWKSAFLDCNIYTQRKGTSRVYGFLSQEHDTICLNIDANRLNMGFLNHKLQKYITDLDGTGDGHVKVLGSWRKLDLKGAVSLNCSTRVSTTNTTYYFSGDTVRLNPGEISFNAIPIRDRKGNRGILDGSVTHKNLSQWACKLKATANNLLVYDTHGFGNIPFYGSVFATGTVDLTGDHRGLFLKAELRSDPDSRFIYNSSETGNARDNSFITFVDSSKRSSFGTVLQNKQSEKVQKHFDSKLNLDFLLDMRESMQVKVYTNISTDDYIDLYGNGFLHAVYDEKDGFSIKGNLDLTRGTYKFTVQDIFPKEFSITKGSTLVFNGNPFEAALNLKTKYLVPSASLGDLTTETSKRKTVKVNCLMDITGTLNNPTLSFDLELPEGNEEERELLASVASTTEQKNMQFIYLLGIGKFYTYDYNNAQAGDSQSSTAMESLISNTLSGQLNNMLGQIIDNGNWDISGNFSTSERGWNSMEVEGMLEGRLLNNRLLINGNFGYRENPTANRNFIGDFEIQWLLNKNGTVSLKAYSKTNDRYFSKTNLTTQGAGIMLRHDFNNWLWWRNDNEPPKEEEYKKE